MSVAFFGAGGLGMECCWADIDPQSTSAARAFVRSFIVDFSSLKLWTRDSRDFTPPAVGTGEWEIMDFASCRKSHAAGPWFALLGPCESCALLHPSHKKARPWSCRPRTGRY